MNNHAWTPTRVQVALCIETSRESTYSREVSLGIVLLSSVNVIVNRHEAGRTATTVLGLESEHSDSILRGLELFSDSGPDFSLLDTS